MGRRRRDPDPRPGVDPQRRHDHRGRHRHLRRIPGRASRPPDGQRLTWVGNKRAGRIEVQEQQLDGEHELHARQLRARADGQGVPDHARRRHDRDRAGRRHERRLPQQPDRGHPVHRDPDPDRRLRRLRLRLDALSRPAGAVHPGRGAAGRAAADRAGARSCATTSALGLNGTFLARLAGAYRASACRWRSTCSTTTSASCRARSWSRPSSTARRTSRSSVG